jgi:hypothetical protein
MCSSGSGPYTGQRYQAALEKMTKMMVSAQSGDRKAMSDLVHVAELHIVEGYIKQTLNHLHHLKGIEAADRARDMLKTGLHVMRENLSETKALPPPIGRQQVSACHLQVNQTQTDTVRRDGSE